MGNINADVIEIREAIAAGEQALHSLKEARHELGGAGGWGVVDILGGGLITNLVKHSKMGKASSCMERAKYDLQRFKRELKDISGYPEIHVRVGDLLTIADFVFDGLLVDVIVQTKISEAKRQVDAAINQVERILRELRQIRTC